MKATARPPETAQTAGKHAAKRVRPRPQRDPRSTSQLTDDLDRAIQETLPFLVNADGISERRLLFAAYIDCVKQLAMRGQEAAQLVATIKATAVEYEVPKELVSEAQQAVDRIVKRDFKFTIDAPENIASADLGALPQDELRERLRAALKRASRKLATQLVEGFGGLVDRQVVGLVHWPSQNAVRYDFYRRRLYCKDHQVSITKDISQGDNRESWLNEVTTHVESGNLVCVLEHHQHDAVDAFQTSIENSAVVMPTGVEQLLEAIPAWMKPSIRIVDGYLIGETVRNTETCREKLVRTTVTEEPIYGLEPAVVLGPYVLAGWGPREIDSVLRGRAMQAGAKADRLHRVYWSCCAVGAQLLNTMFLIASADNEFLLAVALLLFLTGVVCLALALRAYLRSVGRATTEMMFQVLLLGPVLCAASWQAFFLPLGTASIVTGVMLGLLGASMVFMQRRILFPPL